MKGILLIDKPPGMTSFDVVERVNGIMKTRKAGHTGTLDPDVTGLLVIALDEAVKAMPALVGLDKEYDGTMIVHKDIERKQVEKAFGKFTGEITQTPPVRSRVRRIPRKRKIYSLKILKTEGRFVHFRVRCQSGTYIRKLVSDIGGYLGTGAHMQRLRRTKIGPFPVRDSVSLEELEKHPEKHVLPLEKVLGKIGLKKVVVIKDALDRIRNGFAVDRKWITESDTIGNELFGIYSEGRIVAIGRKQNRRIMPKRVFLD
jgi:H/ACA ribonucleoprotein complex subunit 4